MNQKFVKSPDARSDRDPAVTREQLLALLNEDLAREYQAIIG